MPKWQSNIPQGPPNFGRWNSPAGEGADFDSFFDNSNAVWRLDASAAVTGNIDLQQFAPIDALRTAFLFSGMPISQDEAVTASSIGSNGATAAQVQQALGASGLSVTGAGIKVGVLSDSFNDLGGAAQDEADGALPSASNVTILEDLPSGGADEGRAMMQIVHDIAPGASLAFYTAFNSEQDFANGILALAAAGCTVICDDVSYFDEPFFQNGIVAQAIETVEAEGVVYVAAAGNDGSNGYQAAWTPISGTYDGVTLTDAESFGGSLVQTITVTASRAATVPLLLEWNQAYGAATSDLEILVFRNGVLYGTATNVSSQEPNNPWVDFTFTRSGTYQIAIENLSGPDPGLIKEIVAGNGASVTISGANAGTVYGHAMTPGVITAAAVSVANTPAFGVNPALIESFSASGKGTELLFDDNGNPLPSPDLLNPVAVSGVDGINTTVPGNLSDFFGTSAASASIAGVVALILQANPGLTPAQVYQLLQLTTLAMANPAASGAGLVQAGVAVAYAYFAFLQIGSSQVVNVSSGRIAYDDTILSGGTEIVSSGATASGTQINGGIQYIYGSGSSTIIGSGGQQLVFGKTTGTTVSSGGYDYVGTGGTARGTTVDSGGAEYVVAGGSASGTTVSGGGNQYVSSGGVTSGTTISSGGFATVYSGGTANGTTVSSGGVDYVLSGGSANGLTVGVSGVAIVYGTVSGTTVSSGGYDYVGPAGKASGTTLLSGGDEFVGAGGTALGTKVGSGGAAFSQSGGTLSGATVSSGGYDYVQSAGSAAGTTLSGGVEYVLSGGKTSGTTIGKGGAQVVYGSAGGDHVGNGGYDLIGSGGLASGTSVNGGSEYVVAGGSAVGTTVSNGLEVIFGVGSGTVLNSGASEFIEAGGTAIGTTVNSGGTEYVLAGGTASGTNLNAGTEIVYGTATSAIVTGGAQDVEAGAIANATTLSGGIEYVLSSGIANGTVIKGGYEYVFAGGSASNTVISAGTLEIASGGVANTVTFSSGGTLMLDDAVHFGGLVAGFGVPDHLDLANVAYISGTTTLSWTQLTSGANASGTLTVTDGTPQTTADITLLGQYVVGQFNIGLGNDGHGGTLVTDPLLATADVSSSLTIANNHA